MKLQIQVDMSNDAFCASPDRELSRILREVAERVEREGMRILTGMTLRDINGNTVGSARILGAKLR